MAYKNIAVNQEIHARAKVKAAQIRQPLGRIVAWLLEDWLKEDNGEEKDGDDDRDSQPIRAD